MAALVDALSSGFAASCFLHLSFSLILYLLSTGLSHPLSPLLDVSMSFSLSLSLTLSVSPSLGSPSLSVPPSCCCAPSPRYPTRLPLFLIPVTLCIYTLFRFPLPTIDATPRRCTVLCRLTDGLTLLLPSCCLLSRSSVTTTAIKCT